MLSKNIYRMKRSPLGNKRKRTMYVIIVGVCILIIGYGVYAINKGKNDDSKKQDIVLSTGDRPLPQNITIYVNADGGLSLRADHDSSSSRLVLIPNKTQLSATEELDGWYQVTYDGKTGWVSKQYTTTAAPAADPTKDWATFAGVGYKIKYQTGWKAQDYGANAALSASSVVAFSNQDLPTSIPSGSEFLAPVTVIISTKTAVDAAKSYTSIAGVQTEQITVGGAAAQKYTYTSASSNTQMTAVVLAAGSKVFIFTEGGGYAEDLLKMAATFTIG